MKRFLSLLCALLLCCTALAALVSCNGVTDYVESCKLRMETSSLKMFATVRTYVDGDTTHFNVPVSTTFPDGILKARYLAVDTPESTGTIEEYGKQASNFTHDKLASVDPTDSEAIVLESNDGIWNVDSTGGRYLVFTWYRTSASEPYRMLNLELLQVGLAKAKNVSTTKYSSVCNKASNQAIDKKIGLYSGEPDPLYYYGAAQNIDIKTLRNNIEDYDGTLVAFTGIVVSRDEDGKSMYVESFDAEDNMWYGVFIFYGYDLKKGFQHLVAGNEIRFVGSVSFYKTSGKYQITDIRYDPYQTSADSDRYFSVVSKGNEVVFPEVTGTEYLGNKTVTVVRDGEEVNETVSFQEISLDAPLAMKNLKVTKVYTTTSATATSVGAMTLTCTTPDGKTVIVRTEVLHEDDDNNKPIIKADAYLNKTIDIKGYGDRYTPEEGAEGEYQIKIKNAADITVHD
ncbi:MAG: thermonuclease family protein [Firmicutes bacterium]|nr:thermonuclease family protein [Bacillota bacterium]